MTLIVQLQIIGKWFTPLPQQLLHTTSFVLKSAFPLLLMSQVILGKTVEIDESKFRKRKNNTGCIIDGQWIFGGICCETKQLFLVSVEKRDKATLLPRNA